MTGPKLNEKSYVVGERSGTKASAKYVRTSASKARAVLDLIRGLDVKSADEVLQFTDRHVARDVRKVLAGAVANAINNDGQDADELFVVACYSDEGPTLRRFRPRARGRASRINKRSCHITVIVARMSDDRLEVIRAREERAGGGRPQSSAAGRRARVERSRQKASDEATDEVDDDVVDAVIDDDSAVDEVAGEVAADEVADEVAKDAADEVAAGEWAGSAVATDDGEAPEGFSIKVNVGSQQYHEPDSKYFGATKADVWFDTAESAQAAGFTNAAGESAADQPDNAGDSGESEEN